MSGAVGRMLGHNILFYDGADFSHEVLQGRQRFLDHLWLPVKLSELTEDQIFVINRHREAIIHSDQQYRYASKARAILQAALAESAAVAVLEIGCGKFPLDVHADRYLGVDIDPEAVAFVNTSGRTACLPEALLVTTGGWPFDCVASCYAMHFAVDDGFLADLDRCTSADAVFCFNIIADDSLHALQLVARVTDRWPLMVLIKTPSMARREFFFAAAKKDAATRLLTIAGAMALVAHA